MFKGHNTDVLHQFVSETNEQIFKKNTPQIYQDAWQIKNYVIKNIKTKIHTAEMVPPNKKEGVNDYSPNNSGEHRRTNSNLRSKTAFSKTRMK